MLTRRTVTAGLGAVAVAGPATILAAAPKEPRLVKPYKLDLPLEAFQGFRTLLGWYMEGDRIMGSGAFCRLSEYIPAQPIYRWDQYFLREDHSVPLELVISTTPTRFPFVIDPLRVVPAGAWIYTLPSRMSKQEVAQDLRACGFNPDDFVIDTIEAPDEEGSHWVQSRHPSKGQYFNEWSE